MPLPLRRAPPLLAAVLLLGACSLLRAQPAPRLPAHPELGELSGLSRSLAGDGWLWAHNDSGDVPRLFRVGLDGGNLGVVPLPELLAIDWEDLAAFRWQGEPALLIGDIGDNRAGRSAVTLYAVADPGAEGSRTRLLWTLHFRYPGGPRDAEGLAVDPRSGDILILSKRERPPRLFRLSMPAAAPTPGEIRTAEAVGPVLGLPPPTAFDLADDPRYGSVRDWPTALDLAPDGSSVIVTTYKDAWRYRREPGEPWARTFARHPERIALPQWRQTEAGAFSADGRQFCAGSEQRAGFACLPLD